MPDEKIKLYMVYSKVSFLGYKSIPVHWFVPDREEPVAPYEKVVHRYQELLEAVQSDPIAASAFTLAQSAVDELFSDEEARLLQEYLLETHGIKSEIVEVPLPLAPDGLIPAQAMPSGDGADIYPLCEEPDYELPFDAWGYYDFWISPPYDPSDMTIVQSERAAKVLGHVLKSLAAGVKFLQAALELGLKKRMSDEDMTNLVVELYNSEYGFLVKMDWDEDDELDWDEDDDLDWDDDELDWDDEE